MPYVNQRAIHFQRLAKKAQTKIMISRVQVVLCTRMLNRLYDQVPAKRLPEVVII